MLHIGLLTGQARSAPVEHCGYCAAETAGCCSQTHGHMQQEDGALITASFSQREDEPTWMPEAGCAVIGLYDVQPGGGGLERYRLKYPPSLYLHICVSVCGLCECSTFIQMPFDATTVN